MRAWEGVCRVSALLAMQTQLQAGQAHKQQELLLQEHRVQASSVRRSSSSKSSSSLRALPLPGVPTCSSRVQVARPSPSSNSLSSSGCSRSHQLAVLMRKAQAEVQQPKNRRSSRLPHCRPRAQPD